MEKVISFIFVVIILISLCACSNNNIPDSPTTNAPITAPTEALTTAPVEAPTTAPTEAPATAPTKAPTTAPTEAPTSCEHTYNNPTCTTAKICSKCGITEGAALGHTWKDATCSAPKTCSKCGATEGSAAGHSWTDATCTAPKTCAKCGATEGSALEHTYKEATCTAPKTCTKCGATNGTSLGHSWESATCTVPKKCTRCGITNGNALGHSYSAKITAPTCTERGYTSYTCTCGDSYLSDYVEPSHNYIAYVCSMCGKTDEHYSAYQSEFAILTKEYNSNVSELESKIIECNEIIVSAQNELNNATIELAALSPTCPPGYIQDFVSKHWKEYGSTSFATEMARETWKREYDSKSKKLNQKIAAKNAEIQISQANIELYKSQISNLTTTYSTDVQLLKSKYGIS